MRLALGTGVCPRAAKNSVKARRSSSAVIFGIEQPRLPNPLPTPVQVLVELLLAPAHRGAPLDHGRAQVLDRVADASGDAIAELLRHVAASHPLDLVRRVQRRADPRAVAHREPE